MDRRRRLMGSGIEMANVYIYITADKGQPSSTTVDVNGVTYNINFGSTNGITVQVPKGKLCTITPSTVSDYITPDLQIITPSGNVTINVHIEYKIDLVWIPIYITDSNPSSGARPCFRYRTSSSGGNYGEMTTLKNQGSVIYGIRGTSASATYQVLQSEQPSIILNNNAHISYCVKDNSSNKRYKYAYIYNQSGNKLTSKTDGYWTLTFDNPTSIKTLSGVSKSNSSAFNDMSWIQVTKSTYAAVTGLDYPTT